MIAHTVGSLSPAEWHEMEVRRTITRRRAFQWVWWIGAWAFPLLILGGLLALWMLRRARVKYRVYAPWLHDAKPMILVYILPLTIGTILYSLWGG